MAVIQISRIQHRTGEAKDLPDALAEGELGFAKDSGEVFIGAPDFGPIQYRSGSPGVYPYRNLRLLTELDTQHTLTGDVYYHGPLLSYTIGAGGAQQTITILFDKTDRTCGIFEYSVTPVADNVTTARRMGQMKIIAAGSHVAIEDDSLELVSGNQTQLTFATTLSGDNVQLKVTNASGIEYKIYICGRVWYSAPTA